MADTARLKLPLIAAAQAQKHVTHNEALVALDTLVQIAVLDKDLAAPPGTPSEGDCYIVAASPTGAWTGWAGRIARYQDGQWRSFLPGPGWLAWVADETQLYVRGASAWSPVSAGLGLGTAAFQTHETGTWTPTLTFQTPGNLSVSYATQAGSFVRVGKQVTAGFRVKGTMTHSTASGQFLIGGFPFTARSGSQQWSSGLGMATAAISWDGATRPIASLQKTPNTATAGIWVSGPGVGGFWIQAAQIASGNEPDLFGSVTYEAA